MDQIKLFKTITIVLLVANVTLMSVLLIGNCHKNGACKTENACKTERCEDKKTCDKGDKHACKRDWKKKCGEKKCPSFFNELNLDSTQQIAFKQQADSYRAETEKIREEIKDNMSLYFSDLKTSGEASNKEMLMNKIQALQKQKIELTYTHFNTLKSLLKEDQKKNFDTHVDKAMKRILGGGCGKSGGRRGHRSFHKDKPACNKKG